MVQGIPEIFHRADNPIVAGAARAVSNAATNPQVGGLDLRALLDFAKEFVPLFKEVTQQMGALRGMEGVAPLDYGAPAGTLGGHEPIKGAAVLDLIVGELAKVPETMTAKDMIAYAAKNRDSILPQLDMAIGYLLSPR